MTTVNIQADVYLDLVDLDGEGSCGVETNVFFGNDESPQITETSTFSEMLDKWIEFNVIPSSPPTMKQHHKDTASALLCAMINDIERKLGEIEDIPMWVPRGEGHEDDNRR